uniref:Uncharacterized protein n=1 Tax=Romanomermis culicivorax TaxID=13658 RepID=A0A915K6K3_ROMCU
MSAKKSSFAEIYNENLKIKKITEDETELGDQKTRATVLFLVEKRYTKSVKLPWPSCVDLTNIQSKNYQGKPT